nr:sugar transferase [Dorea longicatena]
MLIEYLPWYTETEKHRHDVRPGLTGWAQVNGRNTVNWDRRFQPMLLKILMDALKEPLC